MNRLRGHDPAFDEATCERLLAATASTSDPSWKVLAGMLWPALLQMVRASRAMAVLAQSEDHVRSAALSVLEKLGRDGCRAAHLHAPWREAHPDKTLSDWLRIVTANVVRDYVRERTGRHDRARGAADKRLLHSLATLLPDDDALPPREALSATSEHAARQLAAWAESRLPREQTAALSAWLRGSSFDEMAAELGMAGADAAKRTVRAAVASLRRYAGEA